MKGRYLASFIKKEDLQVLYHNNKMSQKDLSDFYGVTVMCINKRMKKYGLKSRNRASRNQSGVNSRVWRINPSYRTIHKRLEYQRGKPKYCDECKTMDENKKYEWANISGNYKDVNDFRRLCRDCHIMEHPKERDLSGRFL